MLRFATFLLRSSSMLVQGAPKPHVKFCPAPLEVSMHTQLGLQLLLATFCRFLLKSGRRLVYPFAAIIGAGLGVSLAAITLLLALNQVTSLFSPLFGPLSDRWGYRTMMMLGLLLASLAMLAVGILPHYAVLMTSLFAIGIGICICDTAVQAYVGMNIPFEHRGQAIGLTELAWAASSLIGIPMAGLLIDAYHWNTPFLVMGLLGMVGTAILCRILPSDGRTCMFNQPLSLSRACRVLLNRSNAQTLLCYAFLVSCATDIFFVAYALWLVDGFGMGVAALGLATTAIGIAELSGELLTATFADRLGLRQTMLVTLGATVLCYALLPVWGQSVTGALIGIFLLCLVIEFNLVTAMSLSSEALPTARATMMSSFQATSGLGHVCGVVTGGLIWLAGGIAGVALVCAALCLVAFLAVWWEFS